MVHVSDELMAICHQNSREALETFIQQQRAANPDYSPPLDLLLEGATNCQADNIAAYCLENSQVAHQEVMPLVVTHTSFTIYRLLVEHNAVDINYYVPWQGDILSVMAYEDRLDWVRFCLEHGADPNANLREEYMTALASAAATGNIGMMDLMLQYGARMKDSSAIVEAAINGKFEMLKHLLSRGADIDEVGTRGPPGDEWVDDMGSPLHHAIKQGYTEIALYLINSGANIDLKDPMGRTPEDLAVKHGRTEVLDALNRKRDAMKE